MGGGGDLWSILSGLPFLGSAELHRKNNSEEPRNTMLYQEKKDTPHLNN